ncbi:tetratricopeptide repeat protein [Roseicyclus persicicus]|uniref:Tetratricopeptide repeat protein n=1 Tax=Roseicyclus persicicus TaxID=2650661 RepID=A0A7X6JX14_9RHOB|nr:tetratricopeptide repeat protein [Roseibacterium persicicum]NKX44295.1 tetratricopeptide repeat protein [Roseibacterium persicicum]
MRFLRALHNNALAALLCGVPLLASAQHSARADELLDRLAQPDLRNWQVVEEELLMLWSRSGSASADYLLDRGREALAAGEMDDAYQHLTALTDHAPDFAEGWNARATLFFQSNRYGPSIADIQRVLALEPRHFGALTGLGFMLEEMGEPERALEAFRAAQAIHPHREEINEAVARIERALGGQAL